MCPAVRGERCGDMAQANLHEGVGHSREEGSGSCGCPEIVEAGVVLEVEDGSSETDSDQQELEARVDLGDGGGLDGGGGQGGVQVLLDGEGRHHTHVPDVEAGVHQEEVPGDDEAGERGRDEVGVSEGQVDTAWKHKLSPVSRSAVCLRPTSILSDKGSRKLPTLEAWFLKFLAM